MLRKYPIKGFLVALVVGGVAMAVAVLLSSCSSPPPRQTSAPAPSPPKVAHRQRPEPVARVTEIKKPAASSTPAQATPHPRRRYSGYPGEITHTSSTSKIALTFDAGASPVIDFTDFGYASTYRVPTGEVEQLMRQIIGHLTRTAPDVIVLEIADGLYQQETSALLKSALFRRAVNGIVFAAPDSLGAAAGVEWLEQRGLPVLAVAGALTASPLAIQEASQATHLPVLGLAELLDPATVRTLLTDLSLRVSGGGQ